MSVYDVVVIGGSAAGISATLALSRAMLKVLCIDSGVPCNRYAKESHNFYGFDGETPSNIKTAGLKDLKKYPTTEILSDTVVSLSKNSDGSGFSIKSEIKGLITSKKLILCAGVNDNIDKIPIKGIEKFWGNTIIPCPYCHGTEYAHKTAGVMAQSAFHIRMALPTLFNWNQDIKLFITSEIMEQLVPDMVKTIELLGSKTFGKGNIEVIKDNPIMEAQGEGSFIKNVVLKDGTNVDLDVLYIMPPAVINLKEEVVGLGVELTDFGLIKVDSMQQTSVSGVAAAGDCTSMARSIAIAVGSGGLAGPMIAHQLFNENWKALED